MHGYFLSLKLYETARVIANPFAYDEYREKMVREKMEKMAESRIRTKKDAGVKVNKALAEKLLRVEEKAKKKVRHKENNDKKDGTEIIEEEEERAKPKLLDDPRFAKIFEDPAFAIDENSKEFGMLNPSAAAHNRERMTLGPEESGSSSSDQVSNDESGSTDSEESEDTSDSSADGISTPFLKISHYASKYSFIERPSGKTHLSSKREPKVRRPNVPFVPMRPNTGGLIGRSDQATFGQRRLPGTISGSRKKYAGKVREANNAPEEISWIPAPSEKRSIKENPKSSLVRPKRTGVETFGAGLEKGGEEIMDVVDSERHGRTRRRQNIRSGTKNAFRRL